MIATEIDMREYQDPGRDPRMQGHVGYYAGTLRRLAANPSAHVIIADVMHQIKRGKSVFVHAFCTQGRHRSVAAEVSLNKGIPIWIPKILCYP